VNRTATASWPTAETDPQRVGILAASDRMLSGKPQRCNGNLSVSQLAVEANVKYWVVAQKHTDLRDHFQRLAVAARRAAAAHDYDNDPIVKLRRRNAELTEHCQSLERLVQQYAIIINELTLENERLLKAVGAESNVASIHSRRTPQPSE
jgi:hypothetical protein